MAATAAPPPPPSPLRADSGCSAETARLVLEMAETSTGYPGLWRDVEAFRRPGPGTPRPQLSAISEVQDFDAAMASLDRTWDRMKLIREAGWKVPPGHPDLVPTREAGLIVEDLKTSLRKLPQRYSGDAQLHKLLRNSVDIATALEEGLENGGRRGGAGGALPAGAQVLQVLPPRLPRLLVLDEGRALRVRPGDVGDEAAVGRQVDPARAAVGARLFRPGRGRYARWPCRSPG